MSSMITKTDSQEKVTYKYHSGDDWIEITAYHFKSGGSVESNLKDDLPRSEEVIAFNNAVEGVEAMLLALACEGFDLSGEHGHIAVQTALDALANQFG